MTIEQKALGAIRRWWRPLTCVWIAGTLAVHGVIIPLFMFLRYGKQETSIADLALLVTATAGAFAVREWGKIKGVSDDTAS